jgi:hypothetical protein
MTLQLFDGMAETISRLRNNSSMLLHSADRVEAMLYRMAGLERVNEFGRDGWRVEGVDGTFGSPREALAAKLKGTV